jgi:hypothetical protein
LAARKLLDNPFCGNNFTGFQAACIPVPDIVFQQSYLVFSNRMALCMSAAIARFYWRFAARKDSLFPEMSGLKLLDFNGV